MNSNYSFFFLRGPSPIQFNDALVHISYIFHQSIIELPAFFLLKQTYKIIFLTTNLYKLDGDDFLKMIYIKHVLWL